MQKKRYKTQSSRADDNKHILVFIQEGPVNQKEMRAFVILSFIATACAGRLGYDYQRGVSEYAGGPLSLGSVPLGSVSSQLVGPGIDGGSGFSYASSSNPSSSISPAIDSGLNKEFYHYSAPEEDFNDAAGSQRALSSLKKNLRVVFIKAPENNALNNAALQLAKQAAGDRTAIYVLTKQPDISELADQLQQQRESSKQKPEVHFVKYRTPEDALNAQRSIQQQYDALGGTSRSSNEGAAPVLNYASAAQPTGAALSHINGLRESVSSSNFSPSGVIGTGFRKEYLPPIVY